jgi:hypothetical protein
MYIEKSLQGRNPAKPRPKLAQFKDRIESFSKRTLVASMLVGSALAPMQAYSHQDSMTSKGKIIHQKDASMTAHDKEAMVRLVSALGIFGVAYAGLMIYLINRRRRYDREGKVSPEELEDIRRQKISRWTEGRD